MSQVPRSSSNLSPLQWELIDLYLTEPDATLSVQHAEAVEYVRTSPAAQQMIAWIQSGAGFTEQTSPHPSAAFARLARQVYLGDGGDSQGSVDAPPRGKRSWRAPSGPSQGSGGRSARTHPWKGIAAMTAAAAMAGLVYLAGTTRTNAVPPGALESTTYSTAPGERATIRLPDQTVIMLNVASRIDIPRDFGTRSRTVRLRGEASFAVTGATDLPFIVEAGNTQTRVLGTEFGVQAYGPDAVRVAVRSGKVSLNQTVLSASDVAYATGSGVTVQRLRDVTEMLAFAHGRLVLADLQLEEAIPELNRWYNVSIRLDDPAIGLMHIDAELRDGSIGDLMEVLHKTLGVRVTRDGRTLTLYQR